MSQVTISHDELEAMLDRAARRGAKEALRSIGLLDDDAHRDITEMRSLIEAWRDTRKSIWTTAVNYIGISTGGTYARGSNATIKIIGNTSDEQSSLTAGQAYYVQTDGTLGLTAADPSVFAGTAVSATKLLVKT